MLVQGALGTEVDPDGDDEVDRVGGLAVTGVLEQPTAALGQRGARPGRRAVSSAARRSAATSAVAGHEDPEEPPVLSDEAAGVVPVLVAAALRSPLAHGRDDGAHQSPSAATSPNRAWVPVSTSTLRSAAASAITAASASTTCASAGRPSASRTQAGQRNTPWPGRQPRRPARPRIPLRRRSDRADRLRCTRVRRSAQPAGRPGTHLRFGHDGLMMLEPAKRTGAASVDVIDINPSRLETARTLGCSNVASLR